MTAQHIPQADQVPRGEKAVLRHTHPFGMGIPVAVAISLFCVFIFSDYYRAGVGRPFDYVAVSVMALYLASVRSVPSNALGASLSLALLLLPWIVFSAVNDNLLPVAAWLCGILVVLPASATLVRNHPDFVDRALYFGLLASLVFFSIQFAAYYATGTYIDFQSLVGSIQSRGLNQELGYFRPSGAFQEPNAYCTVVFCIISARKLGLGTHDWTHAAGLISMALSQSLWGLAGALVLLFVIYQLKTALIIALGLALSVIALLYFYNQELTEYADLAVTIQRVADFENDSSRQGRIGSLESYLGYSNLLFGQGLTSDRFQQLGANAYAFLTYSFGTLGCLALATLATVFLPMSWRRLLVAGLLFVTFPQFSYMFFWSWLAITFARRPAFEAVRMRCTSMVR